MTGHRDRASELLDLLEAGGHSAADHDRITRATSAHLLAAIHDLLDERLTPNPEGRAGDLSDDRADPAPAHTPTSERPS